MLLDSVLFPVNDVLNRIHESEMVLARPKFHNLPGISASDLGHDYLANRPKSDVFSTMPHSDRYQEGLRSGLISVDDPGHCRHAVPRSC